MGWEKDREVSGRCTAHIAHCIKLTFYRKQCFGFFVDTLLSRWLVVLYFVNRLYGCCISSLSRLLSVSKASTLPTYPHYLTKV